MAPQMVIPRLNSHYVVFEQIRSEIYNAIFIPYDEFSFYHHNSMIIVLYSFHFFINKTIFNEYY